MIAKILRPLLIIGISMISVSPAFPASDKEMEQARTIAAKAYLRYANNGSGYLDEVSASSVTELKKSLKPKELENLSAFMAIKLPSDYASWDKDKLADYWVKVIDSPSLNPEAKGCKGRIRKQIAAMTVTASSGQPAREESNQQPEAPAPAADAKEAGAPVVLPSSAGDTLAVDSNPEEDILADQKAIAEDTAAPSLEAEKDSTWVYVVILLVLLGVVVWLVSYAAKMMKKQEPAASDEASLELQAMLRQEKERHAELQNSTDSLKEENKHLRSQVDELRLERGRLNDEIAALRERLDKAVTASLSATARSEAATKPESKPAAAKEPEILKVIYLGRANARGIFVRADRRVNPGHTVYRLDTQDGHVGSFKVVDVPAVTDIALGRPVEMLAGGCNAIDIEDTLGATSIVTENSGTAIFDDEKGYWKVLRKARIRYE